MTNAQKFQETFGIYATEMWAMPEHDFLKWLNADTPQAETQMKTQNSNLTFEKADERCKGCKHYKLTCDLFSEICKYEPKDEPTISKMEQVDEPKTQTETQNSNLTFEKVQTQVIELPDTHQKFIFARKIEMDSGGIKIGSWEYKEEKDED